MQQIQAQAQAQAETAEKVALAETQKQQILTEQKVQFEQAKTQMDIERYQQEAQIKAMLMEKQFGFDLQLERAREEVIEARVNNTENRKDERVRIEGTQRSQLINQKENDLLPTSFEKNPMVEKTKEAEENQEGYYGMDPFSPI
jgi:multidrug efflux pump subunit AcrA (membrane-fusion protein)